MTPDTQLIQSWASLANGSAIHLIKKPGGSQDDRSADQLQQAQTDDNLERRAQNARVAAKLRNCQILQKNFAACVNAAQVGMDPDARQRHNNVSEVVQEPHLSDLGHFAQDMSESLLTWSHQLERLGKQLVRDEALPDREATEYRDQRRLIQNNMDAARYLSPQLQNFSQFIVPLGEARPRRLAVVPGPNGSGRPSQQ